ncbi:hypothetical protein BO79DRAFT_231984 [Aspergillus costaricaensis CBS 115574]|uniref:Uncharacterized protein n=1 Tax=Aspergillus costaricaensis CBS 115574 TaxID=1448317 RepID=A0ACD1I3P9_9EURO|nr:hypothetical protein BO79DRAFT_231984 [Aspergillus costaricaensis CBS 115574]RAK84850.1 hypothetical protein BO79DRAFT_231984 [Aspergillus costaricaensis CBS 115574]
MSAQTLTDKTYQTWPWNQPVIPEVRATAHGLILGWTTSQPHSLAIDAWDGELTYSELDRLVRRLAGYLVSRGIGTDEIVPLYFDKSCWTIVSMLAVLQAGGAFLALDPAQPKSRIADMLVQTRSRLALTSIKYAETCRELVPEIFEVAAEQLGSLEDPEDLPVVSPDTAAYTIFTSGSTGKPKGVVIEHVQLCTSSLAGGKSMGFHTRQPRMLQFASYAFDACILEIMNTLVYGGCLCVPSAWARMNELPKAMNQMKVTSAFFTPSLLRNLDPASMETLDTLIVGGERVPRDLVDQWAPRLRLLVLAYGPTECTVACMALAISEPTPHYQSGDLGQTITGRAWIVEEDDCNRLTPIGGVGELLIEGPVLARGYLHNDAQTQQAFIPYPQWMPESMRSSTGRMYRTGDLVKYTPQGGFCYVGRRDNQVKIRGQRLEMGEVEYQLQSCLTGLAIGVAEAVAEVVTPTGKTDVGPILFAFLRMASETAIDQVGYLDWEKEERGSPVIVTSAAQQQNFSTLVTDIISGMTRILPPYAVPSIYVPLKRFPLSVSGKTDLKRLRSIAGQLTANQLAGFTSNTTDIMSDEQAHPTTPVERQLQELCIGVQDNFLWLGGDSVSAIGLVAAARSRGLLLTVETILSHPAESEDALGMTSTISSFALLASGQCQIDPSLIEDIYPCSPVQEALMALSLKSPSAYLMQFRFKAAWRTVAVHNPILRTRFVNDDAHGTLQVVVNEQIPWIEVDDQVPLESFLAEDLKNPLRLGQPIDFPDHSGYHFVWTLVLSRVQQAYDEKQPQNIFENTGSFNRFIHHLSTIDTDAAINFWSAKLSGAPVHHAVGNAHLDLATAVLPRKQESGITTATIIKAAWVLLVGSYSNSTDVVTGLTLSGRTTQLPAIESLVGPTIATVPFRVKFQKDQLVIDLLQSIQQQYLDLLPNQHIGLRQISRISPETKALCNLRTLLVIQSTGKQSKTSSDFLFDTKVMPVRLDFALTIECTLEAANRVQVRAMYDDRVLEHAQVQILLIQFEHILQLLSHEEPTTRVWEVCGISDAVPEASDACPEAPSICAWDGGMSYGELAGLTTCLASYLIQQHAKSKWAIIAMLATLKAGGAVDLGESCAGCVLTSTKSATIFTAMALFQDLRASPSPKNLTPPSTAPSDPALVGIVIEHKAVCTSLREHGAAIKLGTYSRVLQFAAYTFDISFGDVFATLVHGGCICIPSASDRLNDLPGAIRSLGANHASLTAAVINQIEPAEVPGLKVLVSAGEAMSKDLIEKWADHVQFINIIGTNVLQSTDDPTLIGRGVGSAVWIADVGNHNVLAPIGAVGEILIEGPILARGYLNDDIKTRASFITSPPWLPKDRSSRRLYKTGDLARYTSDGHISFVGRADGQVKLRGQRVEIGEIEYNLRHVLAEAAKKQSALAAFLVVLNEHPDNESEGEENDCHHIVDSSADAVKRLHKLTRGLENKLGATLPGYMVPTVFIPLRRIPLSASGKVDRRLLRQLASYLSEDELALFRGISQSERPFTNMTTREQQLRGLWQSLLETKSISSDDNFFHLGGDSITAMRLVAAARKEGLALTVEQILRSPVLSEMAKALIPCEQKAITPVEPFALLPENKQAELIDVAASQCRIPTAEIEDLYPTTPVQDYFAAPWTRYQAQCVFIIPSSIDLVRFMAAWDAVATARPLLRTRLIQIDPSLLGRTTGHVQAVIKENIRWQRETCLENYLERDRQAVMGFGDALNRFCIVEENSMDEDRRRFFVWSGSHASYDGVSLDLTFKDVERAYRTGSPPLRGLQFNQFLKHVLHSDMSTQATAFWHSQLSGFQQQKQRPGSAILCTVPDGYQPNPETKLCRDFDVQPKNGGQSGITLSTMVEVAMALVFSRLLGTPDVIFAQFRTGRNISLPGIEDMMAPAMTRVPHRIAVNPSQSILHLLSTAQQGLAEMGPYEHLGWHRIREISDDARAACDEAIHLTIMAGSNFVTAQLGEELGLKQIWSGKTTHVPFRFAVTTTPGGHVNADTKFDAHLVQVARMDQILRYFEQALRQLVDVDDVAQTVADIWFEDDWGQASVQSNDVSAGSAQARARAIQKVE